MEQIDFPALSESMCRVFSLAVTVTHSNCCANLCQTRKVRAQQKQKKFCQTFYVSASHE